MSIQEFFSFWQYPFFWRAVLSAAIASALLGWIGTYLTSRNLSFLGDGVAHASLAAVAIALFTGLSPLYVSLVFALIFALVLYELERRVKAGRDSILAILFTAMLSLGVVLLRLKQGYLPELSSYLFGNILSVSVSELYALVVIGTVAGGVLYWSRRDLRFLTIDPEGAELFGVRKGVYERLLYVLSAVAVVASVKTAGVILASALLILPPIAARPFARTFASFEKISVLFAIFFVLLGFSVAVIFDLPPGPALVLSGAACLPFIFLFKKS